MKSKLMTRFAAMALALMVLLSTALPAYASEEAANAVSVGEAIEALYVFEGEPPMIKEISNTEEGPLVTYEKSAISWVYSYDILSEDDDLNVDITQDKLAEILYNYAKHHDVDVTANGQLSASEWAISYGFIPAASEMDEDRIVTPGELSDIISSYGATDLPKVGVIENGLTLTIPSAKEMTINPLCDFYVIGDIAPSVTVPANAHLYVQLKDSNGALMRDVFTTIKDNKRGMYVDYPGLEVYSGSRESFRGSMMPDLVYDPYFPSSVGDTWMKAYYTDEHYTSVIYGGAYRDNINPVDQYGRKLEPLLEGDYQLTVTLTSRGQEIASLSTQITIGTVAKKIISRFSPDSYFNRVKEYADEKGYTVYIDPFAGAWNLPYFVPEWKLDYNGFINKRWRLVDRMCYSGGMTYFFNYDTSATSTSYTVELGQIGYLNSLDDPERLTYVYWDIGEPEIKQQGKVYTGKFVEKNTSAMDPLVFTRVDHSTVKTPENAIDPTILNETTSVFDLSQRFTVSPGEIVSVNGLCKVIQPEPDQVTLNEDETVTLGNRIASVRYTLAYASGTVIQVVDKDVGLTRTFEDGSSVTSILEFRHNFTVDESIRGNDVRIFAQAIDEFGNEVGGLLYVCQFRVPRS